MENHRHLDLAFNHSLTITTGTQKQVALMGVKEEFILGFSRIVRGMD